MIVLPAGKKKRLPSPFCGSKRDLIVARDCQRCGRCRAYLKVLSFDVHLDDPRYTTNLPYEQFER